MRWSDIPQRWVIHWGAGGVPNGWATKSFSGVYGILLVGLAASVFVELVVTLAVRARAAKDPRYEPLVGPTIDVGRLVALAVSLVCGALAVTLPLGPYLSPIVVVLAILALLTVTVVLGAARMSRALRTVRQADPKRFEGYTALGYSNPSDSRLFVPKLMGMGWTINFAHRLAWPIVILLVGVPIAGTVLALAMVRH